MEFVLLDTTLHCLHTYEFLMILQKFQRGKQPFTAKQEAQHTIFINVNVCVWMCVFSVSFFWKLLLTCSVWNFFLPVGKVWKISLLVSNRENIRKGMRKVFHFSFNTTQWTELVISGNEGSISHKWGMFSITMFIL